MVASRHKLAGARVTVAGLGHFGGGIAVSRWLVEQGAQVCVTDKAEAKSLGGSLSELAGLPIDFHLGGHEVADFELADLVVASPAIAPKNEFLESARARGVPVTTEIRLFIERCPARIIGITGTKGKSTATAMLGAMLGEHRKVFVGGNIGRSLLFDLPRMGKGDLVVLELSSFMLEYLEETQWSPSMAVVTMLAADHLDRHGNIEAYHAAKANIVRFQTTSDIAVLNAACDFCRALATKTRGEVVWFNGDQPPRFELKVPGEHNQVNARAAFAAAARLGIDEESARRALAEFAGLPHRLHLVHEANGVRYFDDSIATIPQAAAAAMEAFAPSTVIQIVGGRDKGLGHEALCAALGPRAKAVLCIGETAGMLADCLGSVGGPAEIHNCGTLEDAMRRAGRIAGPGDVVLLSTGYASYDQFSNFEERGDRFAALARGDLANA